ENGNKEIAYEMLWSGRGYTEKEAEAAKKAKELYA
ncbi:MAG TPA: ligand-binding protein SH3, partial [Candidatus Marinimicrobia bacterium]|nr:ligand-binding protein SH3 [Candidatus Neomarinimicrobiota bacterium]